MRLWTLHPAHLDSAGLVAAWREALLAKAVLRGRTRGYRAHPQLRRFQDHPHPVAAINEFLAGLRAEALRRGYRFDGRKVRGPRTTVRIRATAGQLRYEWGHLMRKLSIRSPEMYRAARKHRPRSHPLFRLVPGPIAEWEVRGEQNGRRSPYAGLVELGRA